MEEYNMAENEQIPFNNYMVKLSKGEIAGLRLEFQYMIQFTDIFIKLFKWTGVPEEIDMDIVMRNLFNQGRVMFLEDELNGYMILPTVAFSKYNWQGRPIEWQGLEFNGKTHKRGLSDSVIIKNSPLMAPCLPTVYEYCKDLANVRQAMKTNVNATKTPIIAKGSKNQLLSLQNKYKKVTDNEMVIYEETGARQEFEVLKTDAPFLADKLSGLFTHIMGQLLTYLGINNTETEKKERLVTDEVNGNNEFINSNLKTRLECYKDACEKINKMFGLNISVELNEEYAKGIAEELMGNPDEDMKLFEDIDMEGKE